MSEFISETAAYVQESMSHESTGHDWHHVMRVWRAAKKILMTEPKADTLLVELGALLHDIKDWKFAEGDLDAGPQEAGKWLKSIGTNEIVIKRVQDIISSISFKGAKVPLTLHSIEAKIVSDADKLDAIGAIGIARAFAFGGSIQRPIYDPRVSPKLHESFKSYQKDRSHTINHFYEKLLLLADRMQTAEGKRMALGRQQFMEAYLEEFYKEWDSQDF